MLNPSRIGLGIALGLLAILVVTPASADGVPNWMQDAGNGPHPFRAFLVQENGQIAATAIIGGTAWPLRWKLRGIETPKPGGLAECSDERERAAAMARGVRFLIQFKSASITDIAPDHEPGVLTGRVLLDDGRDLGDLLVGFGFARRDTAARWQEPWCGW